MIKQRGSRGVAGPRCKPYERGGIVRFRILGPLEVWSGQAWSGIGAPKWRALLATLLLNPGRAVSVDCLIDEVWGGEPPAKATNLIAVYVLRLRRLIGDPEGGVLVTRAPGYQILLERGDLDAAVFADLIMQGRQALAAGNAAGASAIFTEALGLFRGQALADVAPSELVTAEADRLEESRIVGLELRSAAEIECGRPAEVVTELRRLTADHPLRERLWSLLLRALDGAGRQAEALDAYERARTVIADQLGVDPGPELRQLHRQLLRGDALPVRAMPAAVVPPPRAGSAAGGFTNGLHARPDHPAAARFAASGPTASGPTAAGAVAAGPAVSGPAASGHPAGPGPPAPPAPVPSQLPADIPDFTGRGGHVKHLCDLLSDGSTGDDGPGAVVVSLVAGAGGLGKTTLAVHAAHLMRSRFPDGQLYVGLQGASDQPAAPTDVLARFLRELGVDGEQIPVSQDERAALYRTRLAGRRILIVLDDVRDAAQVRPLLPGSASCRVLITSRNSLPDLAGARLIDLDVLDGDEARALLTRIVGAERLNAEPEATAQVLDACAGLPLAIRIAGARLVTRSGWKIQTLASRLADTRRRIDELRAGDLAVRACFQVSFGSLPGVGASGRAGAVGGSSRGNGAVSGTRGVDPARAFRLLGLWQGPSIGLPAAAALLGKPEDDVAEALEVLVDAHLLQCPAAERYRFHDLLRAYALEQAEAEETEQERDAAVRRVLTWYLHTVEAAAVIISPHHARVPLGAADFVRPPLEFASLDHALGWCETERPGLVIATRQAAESGLHEIAWKLPAAAMSFFYRRSHWANWMATHQIGLKSARTLGDRLAEAWMLNNLGMAFGLQRMEEAIGCFEQALALYREIGDTQGETKAANNVAQAHLQLRRFEEAFDAAQRSLRIQRQAGNRYGEGIALGNLGDAGRELGRFHEASDHLQQALGIFRGLGDQHSEADVLSDLGDVHLGLGRVDEAFGCLSQSLAIRRAVGDRHGQAATLKRLGVALRRAGRPDEARASLSDAHRIFEELGDHGQAAEVHTGLLELSEMAHRN
jgi:DNA-binding SARP family transcriptional activator/tetratricopeptide (TPR) repeat protein